MDIELRIKEFIAANLLYSANGFSYSDDASFLEEGIVDSVGIMELVAFVEDQFKFSVLDEDIIPDNFDSVSRLATYIQRNLVSSPTK
ncbi:MAG: acyl carrier protein [Anaerolineales bacterium]|nr:acyl carrier protein [Anaerolineales bacterium]